MTPAGDHNQRNLQISDIQFFRTIRNVLSASRHWSISRYIPIETYYYLNLPSQQRFTLFADAHHRCRLRRTSWTRRPERSRDANCLRRRQRASSDCRQRSPRTRSSAQRYSTDSGAPRGQISDRRWTFQWLQSLIVDRFWKKSTSTLSIFSMRIYWSFQTGALRPVTGHLWMVYERTAWWYSWLWDIGTSESLAFRGVNKGISRRTYRHQDTTKRLPEDISFHQR